MNQKRPVQVIGLPYCFGRRHSPDEMYHMALAPEILLREDSVAALLHAEGYEAERELIEGHDDPSPNDTGGDYRLLPKGDQMSRMLVQGSALARAMTGAIRAGRFPLVAGGGCTSGIGAVAGVMGGFDGDDSVGMIWIDGHADAMTPDTSMNGFMEGMPVTTIAGDCWERWRHQFPGFKEIPYDRFFTIGDHERYQPTGRGDDWHGDRPGHFVDPPVIEELGYERAVDAELDRLEMNGVRKIYLHIDPDAIDPSEFEANSHCSPGGLSIEQVLWAIARAAERFEIVAINLTAWDPNHDPSSRPHIERIMVEATKYALGERS